MKTSLTLILILTIATLSYFLGKKNGSASTTSSMVQNVALVKLIAELGALDVAGTVNLKVTNKGVDDGAWAKFKNYFAENTLQVNIPYHAKFGVDMSNQKLDINTKDTVVIITLPHSKLLSLQLELDKMETMSQTGIFTSASMSNLVAAQKQLYTEALQKIQTDPKYITLAEQHISNILSNYYKPLGYKVQCNFNGATIGTKKP